MKIKDSIRAIGKGVYTVPEVAMILHLPQAKVHRWLKNYYDGQFAKAYKTKYSWSSRDHKMINFLTMIEFYVFYKMREQHISTSDILIAHSHLAKIFKTSHPFASHQLLISGRDILYNQTDETWVKANRTNQIVLFDMLKAFSVKIDFSDTNLAERFWPMGREHSIVVDPHHQFGQPVVKGTNINTATIFAMYVSGEKISTIRELYDLTESEIQDAIDFSNRSVA